MRVGTHKEQTGSYRRPSGCAAGRQTSGSETVLGKVCSTPGFAAGFLRGNFSELC